MKKWLLRLGVGSFFLTNSIAAWTAGDEFKELIGAKSFLTNIMSSSAWVSLIGLNDGLLFLLILSGKWRKVAAIWGIIWLALVIFMTGIISLETIEHLGIALLLIYFYLHGE